MLVLALALALSRCGGGLSGSARVIDGDTIDLSGTKIRLFGIDAPEHDQLCQTRNGDPYRCGDEATAALRALVQGERVRCEARGHDKYGRTVGLCAAGSLSDIGAEMVRRGWAIDYRPPSRGRYRAQERAAQAARAGLWSGRFELPQNWRAERRANRMAP